jgi:tripartite-type tricarboxylate transporter receptor subunit TctC
MRPLLAAAAAIAVVVGAINAAAQTYPSKSITIIVPFAAGGPSDALARIMGDRMKSSLGQSFVVENARRRRLIAVQ